MNTSATTSVSPEPAVANQPKAVKAAPKSAASRSAVATAQKKTPSTTQARKASAKKIVRPAAKSAQAETLPKASKPPKAAKATKKSVAVAQKATHSKKPKLVRDSYTMPKDEYSALATLKERSAAAGHAVKKSELLRAGLRALSAMSDKTLLAALKSVPSLKAGRPRKA